MIPRFTTARASSPDSGRAKLTTAPATSQVRIQVFRRDAGTYFTVAELGAKWHRKPQTIYNWLYRLRKAGHIPSHDEVRVFRRNWARRRYEIREDYAALIRAVFIDRSLTL